MRPLCSALHKGYDATGNWTPAIYHHDALMSVTGVSAHDGATIQTAGYSAFGDRTVAGVGVSNNGLTYTGREKDGDTGLYYYRARYYDPGIGRFISEDPLGFQGSGVNWYAYVGNNPVNGNDPSGLCPSCVGAIYGGIPGFVGGGIGGYAANRSAIEAAKGAVLGLFAGAATGTVTPWLSYEAGVAVAAIGVARTVGTVAATAVVGGASSAVGQFSGNVVTGQPLGTNFSWGAVTGSATGNMLASIPARIAGNIAGTTVGTSIPFGSRSLTIVTPTVQNTTNTVRAIAEGSIGGTFEAAGQAIESQYSQSMPSFTQGAAGGFLLYPNKANTNMMQSVYSK